MRFGNVADFTRGWIVGDFEPTLFKTIDNDIGILRVRKGDKSDGHFHSKHTEHNIIISGKVEIDGHILREDDIFVYEPFDESHVYFLEDTVLLVIKNPSTKNDKHFNIS
tara:strand:- start:4743 stop:5069 length:327 start_codon:yes stop_codon:yes gene_type:complete